jgi:hypothetical protein
MLEGRLVTPVAVAVANTRPFWVPVRPLPSVVWPPRLWRNWGVRYVGSMKENDILLSRAEKLRLEARRVRSESTRLSIASDQQRLLDVANNPGD